MSGFGRLGGVGGDGGLTGFLFLHFAIGQWWWVARRGGVGRDGSVARQIAHKERCFSNAKSKICSHRETIVKGCVHLVLPLSFLTARSRQRHLSMLLP